VATPVWFVQQGRRLLVETDAGVDALLIKPLRLLQSALHVGRPRTGSVILAITPS
jgi:hypothetical protein